MTRTATAFQRGGWTEQEIEMSIWYRQFNYVLLLDNHFRLVRGLGFRNASTLLVAKENGDWPLRQATLWTLYVAKVGIKDIGAMVEGQPLVNLDKPTAAYIAREATALMRLEGMRYVAQLVQDSGEMDIGSLLNPARVIIIDYIPGKNPERITDDEAAQLESTVREMHAAGIAHTDLKLNNVIRSGDGLHIIDFGEAKLKEKLGQAAWTRYVSEDLAKVSMMQRGEAPVGSA